MISIVKRLAVLLPIFVLAILALLAYRLRIIRVNLVFGNSFEGLVVIRAKPDEVTRFTGQVVIPTRGVLNVSEENFYGDFKIHASRRNGTRLRIESLSDKALADDYAVWQLPDGAYVRSRVSGSKLF